MPWGDPINEPDALPAPETKVAEGGWGPPVAQSGAKPQEAPEKPYPGFFEALGQGVSRGEEEVQQGIKAIHGETPHATEETSPAAQPFEWGDIDPRRGIPKVAYGLAKSFPILSGGVAAGALGAEIGGPWAGVAGGAAGAGATAALQTIGPEFAAQAKLTPNDIDGAWDRAVKKTIVSGAFTAAGWAAFPLRPFLNGPVKNLAFQALGIQPAISMAQKATTNVMEGEPVTEGLGQSYAAGAVGTAIPAAGHAILGQAAAPIRSAVALQRSRDAILSRLGEPEESKGWIPTFGRIYTAVKDDLHPLREARNYLTGGVDIPAVEDPYVLARLTRGSYGRAEHFIDHGTFDPVTNRNIGMGLKEVLEPVKDDLENFRKYMLSRRAIELDGRGIKTGIPIGDAVNFVQNNTQYSRPFANWVKYQSDLLNYMVKSGIIGREQARTMQDANKDYAPFYRLMEEPQKYFGGPGAALKVRNPIRGISGSERQILDPIESTIKNSYLYISLADRNMALQALQRLAENSPRGNEIMQKIPTAVRPIEVEVAEMVRAMNRQGVTFNGNPDSFTIFRPNAFRPEPDQIAVFNDGKRSVFKVDPYLGAAVNGLDRESLGMLTKILSAPAKLLRAGATLSPEFIARNPVRDQFSAFIFSTLGRGYIPFYDFAKGIGQVLTKGEGYQNWLKSGGANSAMVSIDRNYMENLIRRMRDPTLLGTVKNVARSPLDLLRGASELMENATRVGENMRMLKRGASPAQAGYASREVTLDFQRIGAKMRAVNSMISFFNAQVEGVDRMFRSMVEQPLGFTTKVLAAITLPSLYLWAANKDDKRLDEIPRWEKDLFWIVPTDKWEPISAQDAARVPKGYTRQAPDGSWEINKGNIYRIPKPFELGVLFGSVPERILDAYYKQNPNAFKDVWKSIGQALLPNFVPQIASPVIEQFANRSLFTDRPLVPRYLENVIPQQQSNPYTTDTAKLIGRAISKIPGMSESVLGSPIIVENYIRSWTGGLGRHVLDASDSTLRGLGVVPTKVVPTLTNADRAIIKAFAVRFPEAGANSIQDFYEEYNRRNKLKGTIAYLRKSGQAESATELAKGRILAMAEPIHKAIGAQLKLVRDTYNNPRMSPDEKRQFIDMSYLQMIKIAQIGNEVFRKTGGGQ